MGGKSIAEQKPWFSHKKFGYGWGLPTVWQGWAVLLTYLVLGIGPLLYTTAMYRGDTYCQEVIKQGVAVDCNESGFKALYMISSILWFLAATIIMTMIASKTSGKASWQWGAKTPSSTAVKKESRTKD